jgi:hypothetical protein
MENTTPQLQLPFPFEAHSVLEPYLPIFQECYQTALAAWINLVSTDPYSAALKGRTMSNYINDVVCHEVTKQVIHDTNVRVLPDGRFYQLLVADQILLRFKKVGEDGRAGNVQTKYQEDYNSQLPMSDIPEATRLVVGYQLDEQSLAIKDLLITCPLNDEILWTLSFMENPMQTVMEMPEMQTQSTPVKPKIMPKNLPTEQSGQLQA